MSYEEYKHMANLLVLHMRRAEEKADEGLLAFFKWLVILIISCVHDVEVREPQAAICTDT
jgi:hypothetical protein